MYILDQCSGGNRNLEWMTLFRENVKTRERGGLGIGLEGPSLLKGRERCKQEGRGGQRCRRKMKGGERFRGDTVVNSQNCWEMQNDEDWKVPLGSGEKSPVTLVI